MAGSDNNHSFCLIDECYYGAAWPWQVFQNFLMKVSWTVTQKRNVSCKKNKQKKQIRKAERKQVDPTEGQSGSSPASSYLCASLYLASPSHCKWTLTPTLLLRRSPAAFLSNHPDGAARWDTLTLASDVTQDFQLLVLVSLHPEKKIKNWIPVQVRTLAIDGKANSCTQQMRSYSPAH